MDDRTPSPIRTLSPKPTGRAPRVGLLGGRYKTSPLSDRMAARTVKDPTTGCWNFQGCEVGNNGYGQIAIGGRMRAYAHRVAWILAHGPIPDDKRVLHRCDNPRCVNPDHLWLGTQAENVHDSVQKGRYNAFGRQKLNAIQVREIRALALSGVMQKDIAAKFGLSHNTVSGIVLRKCWKHLPQETVLEPVKFVHLPVRGEVR